MPSGPKLEMKHIRLAALLAILCVGLLGCYWSSRWLYAAISFVEDTPASVAKAVTLASGAASYHARLAQLQPARAVAEYEAALRLNPRDTTRRAELSTLQEMSGDDNAAETSLLEAARYSRYYLPRFSLAAFYFRHENASKFRDWARQALLLSPNDPRPVFHMAQGLGLSSRDIATQVIPDRAPVLSAWVEFLLDSKPEPDTAELRAASERILAAGTPPDRHAVLRACDALLQAGASEDAKAIWNGLARRHWIPYGPLDAAGHQPVTNSSFADEPLAQGFDWKLNTSPGVTILRSNGLRIEFSGKEPEHVWLASQSLALPPERKYRLAVQYRSQSLSPNSGLRCTVSTAGRNARPLTEGLDLSNPDLHRSVTFETPAEPQPLVLILSYDRQLGTTKPEGVLFVESAQLELLPR